MQPARWTGNGAPGRAHSAGVTHNGRRPRSPGRSLAPVQVGARGGARSLGFGLAQCPERRAHQAPAAANSAPPSSRRPVQRATASPPMSPRAATAEEETMGCLSQLSRCPPASAGRRERRSAALRPLHGHANRQSQVGPHPASRGSRLRGVRAAGPHPRVLKGPTCPSIPPRPGRGRQGPKPRIPQTCGPSQAAREDADQAICQRAHDGAGVRHRRTADPGQP
jgi:hypothetical protein